MRRPYRIALIALCIALFLVISALLSRVLSIDGAEQAAVTSLIQAEARGDGSAMVGAMRGCSASSACRLRVSMDAAKLARPGRVTILEYNQSAGFSLTSTLGTGRVAWRAGDGLPVVQCVRVRRAGDVLGGLRVELLAISVRIKTSADCPARY